MARRDCGPGPLVGLETQGYGGAALNLAEESDREFLAYAVTNLWSEAGAEAIAYLGGRGLSKRSIKQARLGWNPKLQFEDHAIWGMPPELNEKGKSRKVCLRPGIVIFAFGDDGQLLRIKIRGNEPGIAPKEKYRSVTGGAATSFMVLGEAPTVVMVEAEVDALLLYQEARDLATKMATGSAQYKPDAIVFSRLRRAPAVLVALDAEKSGYEAWKWWRANLLNALFSPVPIGKDPTEASQQGIELRVWVGGLVGV